MNMGNLGSGGMSNFNDNYSNSRNFQDRRRGRMDQRRVEPYNKVKTESPVSTLSLIVLSFCGFLNRFFFQFEVVNLTQKSC